MAEEFGVEGEAFLGRGLEAAFPVEVAVGGDGAEVRVEDEVVGFAEPDTGLAIAYVMNQMEPGVFPGPKCLRLVAALYA